MELVKKLIVGGTLLAVIGVGGLASSNSNIGEYLCKKLDKYGSTALGCAFGVYLAETRPVKRFTERVEEAMGRAALGYRE